MDALLFIFLAHVAWAEDVPDSPKCSNGKYGPKLCIFTKSFEADLCTALEAFSKRHTLNSYFFTRLIWQESRFDPNAQSPADAVGIAQFIASIAKLSNLSDPFNPAAALDASARYLAELERKFKNLGLAAAAYNAGKTAAANFKNASAGLPNET